jgi:hypothetical protein
MFEALLKLSRSGPEEAEILLGFAGGCGRVSQHVWKPT